MRKTRSGDGADRSSAIRAACEAPAMYSCRLEALLEINEEATQNFSQSCGKWWWTRTGPIHGQAAPPNNPNHTILLGTIVWMVVLAKHESNVMSDLDDRPTGGLNEN